MITYGLSILQTQASKSMGSQSLFSLEFILKIVCFFEHLTSELTSALNLPIFHLYYERFFFKFFCFIAYTWVFPHAETL